MGIPLRVNVQSECDVRVRIISDRIGMCDICVHVQKCANGSTNMEKKYL